MAGGMRIEEEEEVEYSSGRARTTEQGREWYKSQMASVIPVYTDI